MPEKLNLENVGIIVVDEQITLLKMPSLIDEIPSIESVFALPKKYLIGMLKMDKKYFKMEKNDLVNYVYTNIDKNCLKSYIKRIAFCDLVN